jgi:hypothetical protein
MTHPMVLFLTIVLGVAAAPGHAQLVGPPWYAAPAGYLLNEGAHPGKAQDRLIQTVQATGPSPYLGGSLRGPRSLQPPASDFIDPGKAAMPQARTKTKVSVRANPWNGQIVATLPTGTLVEVRDRGLIGDQGVWCFIAKPGGSPLGWVQEAYLDYARRDERIDIHRGVLE